MFIERRTWHSEVHATKTSHRVAYLHFSVLVLLKNLDLDNFGCIITICVWREAITRNTTANCQLKAQKALARVSQRTAIAITPGLSRRGAEMQKFPTNDRRVSTYAIMCAFIQGTNPRLILWPPTHENRAGLYVFNVEILNLPARTRMCLHFIAKEVLSRDRTIASDPPPSCHEDGGVGVIAIHLHSQRCGLWSVVCTIRGLAKHFLSTVKRSCVRLTICFHAYFGSFTFLLLPSSVCTTRCSRGFRIFTCWFNIGRLFAAERWFRDLLRLGFARSFMEFYVGLAHCWNNCKFGFSFSENLVIFMVCKI